MRYLSKVKILRLNFKVFPFGYFSITFCFRMEKCGGRGGNGGHVNGSVTSRVANHDYPSVVTAHRGNRRKL